MGRRGIKSMKYTDKELAVLKYMYDESMYICGACDEHEDMSYTNAQDISEHFGISMQAAGGIISSLDAKVAITDTMDSARGSHLNDYVINDYEYIAAMYAKGEFK